MKNLKVQIESLLFVTTKPLKISKIKDLIENSELPDVKKAIEELKEKFNTEESGIRIIDNSGVIQFTTAPEQAELVKTFIKDETTGELSRPSLETLTIIAYRQPITKAELEQIRGVNCSMILRNLMIRGLVMKKDDKKMLTSYYFVTVDFLKFLGINDVNELPDYEVLNNNKDLHKLFNPDEEDDEGMDNFVSDDEVNNKEETSKEEDGVEDKSDIEENNEPERLTVNVYS